MDMEEISLSEYIGILRSRKRTILLTTLALLVLAGVVLAVMPRTYMGEVTLIFPSQQGGLASQLLQMSNLPALSGGFNYGGLETCTTVLKSRKISDEVLDDLHLAERYGITRKRMMGALSVTSMKAGSSLKVTFGVPTSWLRGHIHGADLNQETAQIAADVANAYVRKLRIYYYSNSLCAGQKNCEFIGEQIERAKSKLTVSEDRLEKFQKENPTLAAPENSSVYASHALDLSAQQVENRIALADLSSQAEQARRTWKARAPHGVSPSSLVDNPVVLGLQDQLSKLEVRRATLLEDFTEKHPSVVEVTQEISKTRSKINSEVGRVVAGEVTNLHPAQQELLKQLVQLEIGLRGAQAKEAAFATALAASNKKLEILPAKELTYMRLLRDTKTNETVYTTLLAEQAKAQINRDKDASGFVVLDHAESEDRPAKPKIKLTLAASLIMGLILGILIASAQGPIDRKV